MRLLATDFHVQTTCPQEIRENGRQSGNARPFLCRVSVKDGKLERRRMKHPEVIRSIDHAVWRPDKMGKSTLFESPRMLVGLNAFEPGQAHALHAHAGMDKVYQ